MSEPASVTNIPRKDIHAHRLLILDFGSQYTQLIARRVRERGVYSEIHPWDMDDDAIRAFEPSGVILSGGPESVNLDNPPRVSLSVFELGVPAALALFLALGGLAVTCWRGVARRHRDWVFPATGAAASVLVGLHATVDFSLQLPAVAILYATIMGVGVAQSYSSVDA